ncbi:MAG: DUF4197 domain-containing protein [Alphaproteobacteria bacterium]|nr:DUF4197 domain-containing protein [Alphaproteobacteria bacterium]
MSFLVASGVGVAHANWLEKGKNLLDTVTKSTPGGAGALGLDEIANGLREALRVGTERVVSNVGRQDGFNNNAEIHIPLPDTLKKVQSTLKMVGASGMADDLELRLNRAAEAAAPRAKAIFAQAITDMTMDDVKKIYDGANDAATQYFRKNMSAPLTDSMRPVVDSALSDVGAIQAYDQMMGQYKSMPFVPDVKADLSTYVLGKALDALFLFLAREEAAIRENPAQRTTELLQKVFAK